MESECTIFLAQSGLGFAKAHEMLSLLLCDGVGTDIAVEIDFRD